MGFKLMTEYEKKSELFNYEFECRCGHTMRRGDSICTSPRVKFRDHLCKYCGAKYRVIPYIHIINGKMIRRCSVWAVLSDGSTILSLRLEEYPLLHEFFDKLFGKCSYLIRLSYHTVIIETKFYSEYNNLKWRALYDISDNIQHSQR